MPQITATGAAHDWMVKKMSEYGKGYILKDSLNSVIDWDNDIEKWTIRDDDLESLMTEENDVVKVTRCKDCKHSVPEDITVDFCDTYECWYWGYRNPSIVKIDDFCKRGVRRND